MSNKTKGVIYIILSALSFAFMSMFIKLSGDLPAIQKAFFRNLVASFVAFGMLKRSGVSLKPDKKNLPLVTGRALFGTIGMFLNFYAIDHLYIADASMLNKMSPFFAIIFSFILLKEKVKNYQIISVLSALIGAGFILKPNGSTLISFPALLGLLGGMAAGLAYTLLRKATSQGVPGAYIVFFFSVFSCIAALPYSIIHFTPVSPLQLFFLTMIGISATFGQFFITAAYTYAPARELSVYDYSNVIFTGILGFTAFHEIPDIYTVIGCVIIITASIVMFRLNKREYNKTK